MSGRKLVVNVARTVVRSHIIQKGVFLALVAVPVLVSADANAQAAGGGGAAFGTYITGFFQRMDFSAALPIVMGTVGAAGAGISGSKLYKDIQDGGRIGDNMANVMGLGASFLSLGFGTLLAVGRATATG